MAKRTVMIGAVVMGLLGGCAAPLGPADSPEEGLTGQWQDPGPFEATRLRIFPLTRLDVGEDGEPQIVLHLEMMDRWSDTVKAVGDLTVRVWPSRSVGAGSDVEVWEVSLWETEANAGYFDPTSRTYRIPLTRLPEWISSEGGPTQGARVEVEVLFRTPTVGRRQRTLRDSYSFARGE